MSQLAAPEPRLSDLTDQERSDRFARLQERLPPVWRMMRLNDPAESIVVVPSIAPPPVDTGSVVQAYEERLLFLLLLLRQPSLQLIYVTGREVDEAIVDYYLALLPGVIPSQAKARLHMIAAHDGSPRPLTTKLLERPRCSMRSAVASPTASAAFF